MPDEASDNLEMLEVVLSQASDVRIWGIFPEGYFVAFRSAKVRLGTHFCGAKGDTCRRARPLARWPTILERWPRSATT